MTNESTSLRNAIHQVEQVVVGKTEEIELCFTALLAKGHVLLEDVPGVGKTMMVRAIARSIGAEFKRIQFTPDLLPSDVTGISIYNQKTGEFEFRPGPIMGNVVLADEINRTSPKTQSALLEALEEGSVTIDGETRPLPSFFFVMATQNPMEYGGTYPLPEAQLDRFLMKLKLGYPSYEEELEVLERVQVEHPIERVENVLRIAHILTMQKQVRDVYMDDSIRRYIVELVTATRNHQDVSVGVSPRGSIALMRAAQAYSYLKGRDYVIPDDVKYLSRFVLPHRIHLHPQLELQDVSQEKVIDQVLKTTEVPVSVTRMVKRG